MASVQLLESHKSLKNNFLDNKSIPIIHYSLFKEDENIPKVNASKHVDLEKVIRLLIHPHSSTLYERHIIALKKMVKHSNNGFMMKDSLDVSRLLTICSDRSSTLPQIYLQPIVDVLQICSKAVFKERSSDKILYHKIYVDLISQMGYTFRLDSIDVRLQICKSLYDLYSLEPCLNKSIELMPNDQEYTRSAIDESDVTETMTKSLTVIGECLELRIALMNLLQLLTSSSRMCCNKMLNTNGARILFNFFSTGDHSGNTLFRAVEILWNLVEQGDKKLISDQLCNKDCIGKLRDAFIGQLSKGYSSYDRQLRNDLLVLATLLTSTHHTGPFVETGFVKQLTLLATFQEIKSHNPLVKNLKLSLNHEDFEMKKLLINILVILSENRSVIQFLEEGQFLLSLFINIHPMANSNNSLTKSTESNYSKIGQSQISVWKPAYLEELQLHSLSSLSILIPRMLNKFQDLCGVNRLLMLVEWCISEDMAFAGNGNSFHAVGGRSNKLAQLRYCMRLILSVVRSNDDAVNMEFVDEGCISLFIEILGNVIKSEDVNSAIDIEIQCDMLLIFAILCEKDPHRKELFGQDGVAVLIGFLKNCLKIIKRSSPDHNLPYQPNPPEANGLQKLVIAVIDAVWGCVIGCYATEHLFLDQNGAFLLLDLLELLPSALYSQMLGCLVDLSENVKALNHLSTWRGGIMKDNKQQLLTAKDSQVQMNIGHLLCRIWRQEESRLDVGRGEFGSLLDINNPLMGEDQRSAEAVTNISSNQPSRAILEVSESLRANIYSLLSRLGYLDYPGLHFEDHITLTVIESYLEFKMGEIWTEIQSEFEMENIRPVSPDIEALEWISRCIEQEGVRVSKIQEELIEAKAVQDGIEEFEFYSQLRENHRQKEKNIQNFQEFVERTSNYEKLKQAKQNQISNIDASRINNKHLNKGTVFHKADIENINVTKFCSESVKIDSTPIEILGGALLAMKSYSNKRNELLINEQALGKRVVLSAALPQRIN